MIELITLSQLDNICARLSGQPHVLWEKWEPVENILDTTLRDFFNNLYKTGLRVMELQDSTRWEIVNDGEYKCTTLKDSNDRTFTGSELTTYFVSKLETTEPAWETCRYSTANIWLKRAIAPYSCMLENKYLTSHLFRHYKVKAMTDRGYTLEQISEYLGEVSTDNTKGYRDSKIFLITP